MVSENGPKTKKPVSRKKRGRKPVKQQARVDMDEVIEFDYKGIKLIQTKNAMSV